MGQVLLNRGLSEAGDASEFLSPRLAGLSKPDAMADREKAAERLCRAIESGERVVVFGDYDVDGTTSAAILADVIEALGGDVRAIVANRFEGGYGFSDPALDRALSLSPGLIVTCDCGSSDHARVARAMEAGVDVIVVDHHLVPDTPLPAYAFLNPHRPECGFAYKGLCSAGLALTVGAAVRAGVGKPLDLRAWLDLVALGTVADVAPLDGDNRRLVRAGLARLASDQARPGVVALREAVRIKAGSHVGAIDIAFRMAPRLNAAGRLGDPTITLDLLRARTVEEARGLAAKIERINQERRDVERAVTEAAIEDVEECGAHHGIVAAGDGWHRGVVGISAARLVDRYNRPALTIGVEDGVGHGSGRAPDGFPLHDALGRCSDLLLRWGGHNAAVGLTIEEGKVPALREAFEAACEELSTGPVKAKELPVEVRVDGQSYPLPMASELARLEPVGEANPEPLFELPAVRVDDAKVVGEGHLKLRARVGGRMLSVFGYDLGERVPRTGSKVTLWGHLRPDNWTGGEAVELRLLDWVETP